ncbi:hypothetical protein fugu_013643 [Takifugu bimaculatus]|uniref:Uncharacterized protein n=1 Tax=Takifugu bimaculatus TaxID=433685 RepID=A0A4Z2C3T8_9TELE|nr:hypothetical protein fugu_013643 [Takifugu bimaculatus]
MYCLERRRGQRLGDWFGLVSVRPAAAGQASDTDPDRHGTTVAFRSISETPVYTQSLQGVVDLQPGGALSSAEGSEGPAFITYLFIYLKRGSFWLQEGLILQVLPLWFSKFPPDTLHIA